MSTSALPELINETDVARLCGQSVEWVRNRRFHLPCNAIGLPIVVRREDLRIWVEAAKPPRELRESEAFEELQAKYPGSANRSVRLSS